MKKQYLVVDGDQTQTLDAPEALPSILFLAQKRAVLLADGSVVRLSSPLPGLGKTACPVGVASPGHGTRFRSVAMEKVNQFAGFLPKAKAKPQGENVLCPLGGKLMAWCVQEGQTVVAGDVLCIAEAMKMENRILAEWDGVVGSVSVQAGALVNAGDVLCVVKGSVT